MTTPPGQEPRPGFTPRGGQARPGSRGGDARWSDNDPSWRDEPRIRRPNSGGPGRVPGSAPGNSAPGNGAPGNDAAGSGTWRSGRTREPGRDAGDHWGDGRPPGQRHANGSRPPGGNAFSDRDVRGGPDRAGGGGGQDPRDGPNGLRPEASRRPGPSFSPASPPASTAAARGTGGSTAQKHPPAKAARPGLYATPALRWIGALPVKRAVLLFAGTVLAGMILTVVMGQEPGFLLGLFLILGSVAAGVMVRRGGPHKFIPLPALAYLVAATFTGMAHDSGSLNSSRQFVVDFLTWIGGSFVAVTASTILVVLIALTRWLLSGRLVSGQLPATGPGRAPSRPTSRDPWGNRDRRGWDALDDRAVPGTGRGSPLSWRNQGRPDDRGPRAEGTWPSQPFRGDRERRDENTQASQARPDDRGRRDEGTWPSQSMRDNRATWDRGPDGDPRERRPRDRRDSGRYDDQGPRENRRSPSGPRDLW